MFELKVKLNPSILETWLKTPDNTPSKGAQFGYASKITEIGIHEQIRKGRLANALLDGIRAIDGRDVLDLGCGVRCPFQVLLDLWCPGSRIISIDLDKANFGNYEGSRRNREFRFDDAQKLETVPDASVGAVFQNLLFNDNSRIDHAKVMEQIARVLIDGGIYIEGIGLYFKEGDAVLRGPYFTTAEAT